MLLKGCQSPFGLRIGHVKQENWPGKKKHEEITFVKTSPFFPRYFFVSIGFFKLRLHSDAQILRRKLPNFRPRGPEQFFASWPVVAWPIMPHTIGEEKSLEFAAEIAISETLISEWNRSRYLRFWFRSLLFFRLPIVPAFGILCFSTGGRLYACHVQDQRIFGHWPSSRAAQDQKVWRSVVGATKPSIERAPEV